MGNKPDLIAGAVVVIIVVIGLVRISDKEDKAKVEATKLCEQFQMKAFRNDGNYFCAYGVLKEDIK